jgi:DNA mismatch endonuclease (patch repair protein)
MDIVDPKQRSAMMAAIGPRHTLPELRVRRVAHRMGFRFRLHVKNLPGRPDIVLPRYRTVILVHGCFWHRHRGCANAVMPKTRSDFWASKFDQNVARDSRAVTALRTLGWNVAVIWECETEDVNTIERRLLEALPLLKRRRSRRR